MGIRGHSGAPAARFWTTPAPASFAVLPVATSRQGRAWGTERRSRGWRIRHLPGAEGRPPHRSVLPSRFELQQRRITIDSGPVSLRVYDHRNPGPNNFGQEVETLGCAFNSPGKPPAPVTASGAWIRLARATGIRRQGRKSYLFRAPSFLERKLTVVVLLRFLYKILICRRRISNSRTRSCKSSWLQAEKAGETQTLAREGESLFFCRNGTKPQKRPSRGTNIPQEPVTAPMLPPQTCGEGSADCRRRAASGGKQNGSL